MIKLSQGVESPVEKLPNGIIEQTQTFDCEEPKGSNIIMKLWIEQLENKDSGASVPYHISIIQTINGIVDRSDDIIRRGRWFNTLELTQDLNGRFTTTKMRSAEIISMIKTVLLFSLYDKINVTFNGVSSQYESPFDKWIIVSEFENEMVGIYKRPLQFMYYRDNISEYTNDDLAKGVNGSKWANTRVGIFNRITIQYDSQHRDTIGNFNELIDIRDKEINELKQREAAALSEISELKDELNKLKGGLNQLYDILKINN